MKQLKAGSLVMEIKVYARETVYVLEETSKTLEKRVEKTKKATLMTRLDYYAPK